MKLCKMSVIKERMLQLPWAVTEHYINKQRKTNLNHSVHLHSLYVRRVLKSRLICTFYHHSLDDRQREDRWYTQWTMQRSYKAKQSFLAHASKIRTYSPLTNYMLYSALLSMKYVVHSPSPDWSRGLQKGRQKVLKLVSDFAFHEHTRDRV